jgi:hypothetical protein
MYVECDAWRYRLSSCMQQTHRMHACHNCRPLPVCACTAGACEASLMFLGSSSTSDVLRQVLACNTKSGLMHATRWSCNSVLNTTHSLSNHLIATSSQHPYNTLLLLHSTHQAVGQHPIAALHVESAMPCFMLITSASTPMQPFAVNDTYQSAA